MALIAATMAGPPKPWVMREKPVSALWVAGSSGEFWGWRPLPRGDLSWLSMSTSSLMMCLESEGLLFTIKIIYNLDLFNF